jgi:hypothetical protein
MMATSKRRNYLVNCLIVFIYRQVLFLQHFNPTLLPVHEASRFMFTFCAGKPAATHTFSQTYRCKTALRTLSQDRMLSVPASVYQF